MNYRYVASMPMDGTRSIVHLKADDQGARFRFISFERTKCVDNGGFPVNGRTDIIVIPLSQLEETEGIKEEHVKYELSKLHGCSPEDITISISQGVRGRRGGIPDSSEYVASRIKRSRRYSHGLDPDMPPPGWIPD